MHQKNINFIGYNSLVEIIEENNQKFILKKLKNPFPLKLIRDIRKRILLQRKLLAQIRVPISELIYIKIIPYLHDYNLLIKEKYEGVNFLKIITENNIDHFLNKLLDDIYKPLLFSTNSQYLKVGIDTKLSNFVYKSNLDLFCYIDFIPPKVYYGGHYSQEIPEISGPFYDIRMLGHYDRAGVFYVQYVNLIREFPLIREYAQRKFLQFSYKLNQLNLKIYLTESPFYLIKDQSKAVEFIKNLNDWQGINYYRLREAICFAAELNEEVRKKISYLFKLTHPVQDPTSNEYYLFPEKKFNQVKEYLINAF